MIEAAPIGLNRASILNFEPSIDPSIIPVQINILPLIIVHLQSPPMPFENLYAPEFRAVVDADPEAVILDVRTPGEVAEGIIPGAIQIDIYQPDFSSKILDLNPAKNYYVYCRSGGRSSQACMMLESCGFTGRLVNLAGGITNYDGPLGKAEV